MIKGVIFDLDGLLVDTEKTYRDGWLWAFERAGIAISSSEVDSWSGLSWIQTADYLAEKLGSAEKVVELRADRETFIYQQLTNGSLKAKPGALEALTYCKQAGLKTGLATSTVKERAHNLLTHLGLIDFFDELTFGDEVLEHKPQPTVYLKTLAKLGLQDEEALAVEDSFVGAKAATNAKISVVLIPDSSFGRVFSEAELAQLQIATIGKDLRAVIESIKKLNGKG